MKPVQNPLRHSKWAVSRARVLPNLGAAAESQARMEACSGHSRCDEHLAEGDSGRGGPRQPALGTGTARLPTIQHKPHTPPRHIHPSQPGTKQTHAETWAVTTQLEGTQTPELAGPRALAAFNAPLSNFLRVWLGRYRLLIWANGRVQPGEEIKVAHILFWNELGEGRNNLRGNYTCLRVTLELVVG